MEPPCVGGRPAGDRFAARLTCLRLVSLSVRVSEVALEPCWPLSRAKRPLTLAKSGPKRRLLVMECKQLVVQLFGLSCGGPAKRRHTEQCGAGSLRPQAGSSTNVCAHFFGASLGP